MTRSSKVIQVMEPPCSGQEGVSIEALDMVLFLMGGCSWLKDANDEVYFYDVGLNHWSKPAPMPTARCYFVSASLNEKIYVTGEFGLIDKSPNSWDIYNKATDSWCSHKNPMLTPDIVKFTWWGKENEIALCWSGPTVVVDGTLYMLDQSLGTNLMMWINETKEWVMVCRLSDKLTRPPCELVAICRKIYVVGQG
ncbi:F-box/kelch-repeat protein SKIP4 [Hordeum vulgare]|nr:F-box/kelch-repeat protein SKIP4 [Hordeum vulgare]